MSEKKKIYVASPLGFSEAGREFMNHRITPVVEKAGYEVLDPWKLTSSELVEPVLRMPYGEERRQMWQDLNIIIGENNERAIRQADGLLAVLDGTDVDSGTASEIGFAAALGKPILGYRGDFRMAGENEGAVVNLQVEYFIKLHGGKIITEIDNLKKELISLFG